MTVSAWINPDALAASGIFTTNKTTTTHRGFWFTLSDASGHLESSFGDNTGPNAADRRSKVSASAVSTGSWQHVAARIRGAGDMDLLINASDAGGSYSGTGGAMAYNTGVAGRIAEVGGLFFDGKIAEVGLWTVSLSDAEITALAKGVSPRLIRPDVLLGHWPIWGVSTTEVDSTANSNEGTLAGTAPVANHSPTAALTRAA